MDQHSNAGAGVAKGGKFKLPKKLILIVLIVILVVAGAIAAMWKFGPNSLIKSDQYQAVFLANGQVYFGKMQGAGGQYIRLKDVYYLQTTSSPQSADSKDKETQTENKQQLIKLGSEIHGPEDEMIIERDQVLFFENLKNDGTVGKAIQSDKQKKN